MRGRWLRWVVPGVAILGFELAREWFVLRFMGFEPGRFVEWVRSDEL